jgi:hypothetical protein
MLLRRQLLNNPSGAYVAPSVAEQWCHDIDQLIVAAINTMPCGGQQANHLGGVPVVSAAHLCSPAAPPASSTVRASSLAMIDLWDEVERCRSGEDDRMTMERQRKRRRNLDGDFGAVDTTPVRQTARTPTSPGNLEVAAWRLPHIPI